jgi:hypothetical protein
MFFRGQYVSKNQKKSKRFDLNIKKKNLFFNKIKINLVHFILNLVKFYLYINSKLLLINKFKINLFDFIINLANIIFLF